MHNLIPPKLAYGLIETIAMKFTRPLPATSPKALTYVDGNFAIGSARGSPARVQTVLVCKRGSRLYISNDGSRFEKMVLPIIAFSSGCQRN